MKNLALYFFMSVFMFNTFAQISFQRCATEDTEEPDIPINTETSASGYWIQFPIVFHIITKTDGTYNVTDEQINMQMEKINSVYQSEGIYFVLYKVNRIQNNNWATNAYSDDEILNEMKENLAFMPEKFLNVYSINSGTWIGKGNLPWDFPTGSPLDGVIIDYGTFPQGHEINYNLGATLVHEIGHYLGLYHTYRGKCDPPGDEVDDTPAHNPESQNPTWACNENYNTCPSSDNDPIHNYMNNTDDYCMNELTSGQFSRIREKVSQYRPILMNEYLVIIDQKYSSGERINNSSVYKWEGNNFNALDITDAPAYITFQSDQYNEEVFKASDQVYNNQKFKEWRIFDFFSIDRIIYGDELSQPYFSKFDSRFFGMNKNITIQNTLELTPGNGDIKFKDPWLIYYEDPNYFYQLNNRGSSAAHLAVSSPLDFNSHSFSYYKGVFLNQDYNIPGNPYYSVQAISPQTININGNNHKFYFQNWSGSNVNFQNANNIETGVVFTNDNAVVNANYKGNLVSNTQNAISSNSQKKVAKTSDGTLHMVYESMNQIWYTKSTDNGVNWSQDLMISHGEDFCMSPDISAHANKVGIVYQVISENVTEYYNYLFYKEIIDGEMQEPTEEVYYEVYNNLFYYNPVISVTDNHSIIVWKPAEGVGFYYNIKYLNSSNEWSWIGFDLIPETDGNSLNPSISVIYAGGYKNRILVWQQFEGHSQNGEIINIYSWDKIGLELVSNQLYVTFDYYNNFINLSQGSPTVTNIKPSVTLAGAFPLVSWTGIHTDIPSKTASKENTLTIKKIIARGYSNGKWNPTFFQAGSEVETGNVAGRLDHGANDAVLAWAENNGQYSRYAKMVGGNFQTASNLCEIGKTVQINSAQNFSHMKAFVLKGSNPPFSIIKTSNDFGQNTDCSQEIEKTTGEEYFVSYGKSGLISYSTGLSSRSVNFIFNISDIMLNGEILKFVERQDTLPFNTIQELNDALKTVSFNLNNNSELLFSNLYYVVNGESADSLMSENDNINFKVELVKVSNDQPVGEFDNIIYNKNNVSMHSNVNYLINCAGIEDGEYYLRLKVEVNGNGQLLSADVQNDGSLIAKKNYTELSFNGENLPKTYSLSPNYPNPFNPVTTISYQLPQEGFVTLKVYDILGREVATLVNEQKSVGRYNIKFSTGSHGDASQLSSGVYLYRVDIKGIDGTIFSDIKKMMLLK